jgi:hypothetical protein
VHEGGQCTDGIDNDCDGGTDCQDATGDCNTDPACQGPSCPDGFCASPIENQCNCPQDCGFPLPESNCTDNLDNDCDLLIDCNDPDCATNSACQYQNWVMADDFEITCAECKCDVNGDGLCNNLDMNFFAGCFGSTAPGCDRVDFNCDGIVNNLDLASMQCLFAGGQNCCPNRQPKVKRVRWYGSYFDLDFQPPNNTQQIDAWLVALHSDVPPQACPPPPAGFKPVDLCGVLLDTCPAAPDYLWQPNGGGFPYPVFDPGNALSGYNLGDEFRICGYFDPNYPTPCNTGNNLPTIVVQAAPLCDTKVSRPDRLIAQWAIDPALVQIDQLTKTGCDGHQIFCYTADWGCLMCDDFAAGEWDAATNTFYPIPGRTYWLSVQAAVGRRYTPIAGGGCQETNTGNSVNNDFWGWHTTPPGHQHKDDAYMGELLTGCPGECLYNWMSHIHCSQPEYQDCCDDRTKSIDLAFCLYDVVRRCTNNNAPCVVNADCTGTGVCADVLIEHWCQPVNPGPPGGPGGGGGGPPKTPKLPGGNPDEYADTTAQVVVNINGFPGPQTIQLQGPTLVARGNPLPGPAGAAVIETEMIAMELVGNHPMFGPVRMHLNPDQPSHGQAMRGSNSSTLQGFFDVNIIIDLPMMGQQGRPDQPVHVQTIDPFFDVPPFRTDFRFNGPAITIRDQNNQPIGQLIAVIHQLPYRGGVNVHSDVYLPPPPVDCCEPEPVPNPQACVPAVCPDTTEVCVPVCWDCHQSGFCQGTVIPCVTNADCPGGVACIPSGPVQCFVSDCECRRQNECRAEYNPALPDPIRCINGCPPGLTCTEDNQDTDGDGVDDRFCCRCDQPTGGVCCDTSVFPPVCYPVASAADCPGVFHPGTACTQPEACCVSNAAGTVCFMVDPVCCVDMGGSPQPGQTCTQPVACCLPNGTCEMMDPICCNEAGGTVITGGQCTQVEACCLPSGICTPMDPLCCVAVGGTPHAGACLPPQPCCMADGTCQMLDPECCIAAGGTPMAGGQCTQDEACCLPDGSCDMMDPLCCHQQQGTPLPGNVCQPETACCMPDGTCDMRDPLCCEIAGGISVAGGTCSTFFVACCLPNGTCQDVDPLCCQIAGGTSQGPGTSCATHPCTLDCAPNPTGTGCNPHVCPIAGQVCIPTKIECGPPPLPCRVVECECKNPQQCHINLPTQPGVPPFCSGPCPPFKKCIRFQKDLNGNGNPEYYCKCVKVIPPLDDIFNPAKVRYISFQSAADPGELEAVQVTLVDVNGFPAYNGQVRWAGPAGLFQEGSNPLPTFPSAALDCGSPAPAYSDWAALGLAHLRGAEIVPRSRYEIRTVSSECDDLTEP